MGKSNGKKWPQIWKFLLIKGVKLPWQKSFLQIYFHLLTPFKVIKRSGLTFENFWLWRCEIASHFFFFFSKFCFTSRIFLVSVRIGREMLCPSYAGFFLGVFRKEGNCNMNLKKRFTYVEYMWMSHKVTSESKYPGILSTWNSST